MCVHGRPLSGDAPPFMQRTPAIQQGAGKRECIMPRPKPTRPTDAEIAILNTLWNCADPQRGLAIRQIVAELKKTRPVTYASTQTLVRIMEKKGLLRRGEERYPALFAPVAAPDVEKGRLLRDFIDRVFSGSMKQLVQYALRGKKSSRSEMEQIQRIIDQMED